MGKLREGDVIVWGDDVATIETVEAVDPSEHGRPDLDVRVLRFVEGGSVRGTADDEYETVGVPSST